MGDGGGLGRGLVQVDLEVTVVVERGGGKDETKENSLKLVR